jgi:hypothetical protein
VHPEQNDAGTTVKVTGEAVEVLNHPTVVCALRDLPPLIDSGAAAANVGIIGTMASGLLTGSPTGAMDAGTFGALGAGTKEFVDHQQNLELQREQLNRQLLDQQREIRDLLTERARLNNCEVQEMPLASCDADSVPQSEDNAVSTPADYQNLPLFELKKQAAEGEDYITNLKQQVSDMKWQMDHPSLQ